MNLQDYEQLAHQLKSDTVIILAIADCVGMLESNQLLKPYATPEWWKPGSTGRSTDENKIAEVWTDPQAFHPDAESWISRRAFSLAEKEADGYQEQPPKYLHWGCEALAHN